MLFTDKDGHLTKAFQKEKMTLQVNC